MLQPGTLINQRYQIVGQVGKGGTGEVYEAIDTRLRHRVALKQMLITDPAYARVFEHEAILLADLKHIRLPKVTDHFSDSNGQFLVMEFIPGADLAALLQQQGGPFPVAQVLLWADQLLELLAYLHNRTPPVLHRDIKPGNLKVAQDGTLMLLDFGLAKGVLTQTHLTSDRSVFGYTEAYAPLEQIQGTGTEARSDLYAVGATLYHLLVGTPPPDALTRAAQLLNQQPDPLRPPHERTPAMPQAVSAALVQALSIQITARPANATVLRDALRAALPSSAGTSAPLDPTLVAPFQTVAARQGGQQPPAVGTRTLVVPSQPKSKLSPLLWLGALVVVLVGAFFLLAKGGTPTAQPPASGPVVTSAAGVVPPTDASTITPIVMLPTLAPTTVSTVPPTTVATADPVPSTVVPTTTPVPPTITLTPQLRDISISLEPFANDNIRNLLPKIPLGIVSFGNSTFDLGNGTSKVSTECSNYPNWPSQVSIPVGKLTGVEQVRLLMNAGYTVGFHGQKIGEVDLLFDDSTIFSYDLVLGDNIREWRIEVLDTVVTINSKDTVLVYDGQSIKGDKGVVDMIRITVPSNLRVRTLKTIVVRDIIPGNPCFFFAGLNIQAR